MKRSQEHKPLENTKFPRLSSSSPTNSKFLTEIWKIIFLNIISESEWKSIKLTCKFFKNVGDEIFFPKNIGGALVQACKRSSLESLNFLLSNKKAKIEKVSPLSLYLCIETSFNKGLEILLENLRIFDPITYNSEFTNNLQYWHFTLNPEQDLLGMLSSFARALKRTESLEILVNHNLATQKVFKEAMNYACVFNDDKILKGILKNPKYNMKSKRWKWFLEACKRGNNKVLEVLVTDERVKPTCIFESFRLAMAQKHLETCKLLLTKKSFREEIEKVVNLFGEELKKKYEIFMYSLE